MKLLIQNQEKIYQPILARRVTLTLSRQGSPGMLEFEVVKDGVIDFQEGNMVMFFGEEGEYFRGYVFTKKRSRWDETILVTAYDQMRYLKNHATFLYPQMKASELVEMIAKQYRLKTGQIADTKIQLTGRIEENRSLFDIIDYALEETKILGGGSFVLYDKQGELTLTEDEAFDTRICLSVGDAGEYDYRTTIDDGVYSRVMLYSTDLKQQGAAPAVFTNEEAAKKWGILQYYEKNNFDVISMEARAKQILEDHQKKHRYLRLKNLPADRLVRAGERVRAVYPLGDIDIDSVFRVERAVHQFSQNCHLMDLTLKGEDFLV